MEATVLIPTHSHGETLRRPVASVQAQTLQDFEVFLVGDGVPEATRDLVRELARGDARIRFFDFPKGERHGELHRHAALANARGRCVCYLCDDDLWMPSHLQYLTELLREADLASTASLVLDPEEAGTVALFDINDCRDRELLEASLSGFGLSCGGHTLEAYRRLPHGWRTTPPGIHTDTYMWQQFLEQSWCRAVSAPRPTVLRFGAKEWDAQPRESRLGALDRWLRRITEPGGESRLAWSLCESSWGPSTHPLAHDRLLRFNPQPDFQPYRLGDTLVFGASPTACRYLSWGWSFRESWGVWSDGEAARITLSLADPPAGSLALEFTSHVFRERLMRPVKIEMAVNGRRVDCQRVPGGDHGQVWRAEIPSARRLDLRFSIPDAAPARQVTKTVDHRRLGIGLIALHIRQAP